MVEMELTDESGGGGRIGRAHGRAEQEQSRAGAEHSTAEQSRAERNKTSANRPGTVVQRNYMVWSSWCGHHGIMLVVESWQWIMLVRASRYKDSPSQVPAVTEPSSVGVDSS